MIPLLVLAAIADLAIAGLLVAVSGFIVGAGPESMHAGAFTAAGYVAAVLVSLAAPVAGFIFNARGKGGLGLAVALLPPAGALLAVAMPAPY